MMARPSHDSTRRWVRLWAPALVLVLLALAAGPVGGAAPAAASGPPALFGEVPQGRAEAASPATARSRYVSVDVGALFDTSGLPRRAGASVALNLFPDARFTGVVDTVTITPGGYNWSGDLSSCWGSSRR